MWNEWLSRGGYVPLVDITHWPWAYRPAGIFTLVFELSFVFLVFTRLRPAAQWAASLFHLGTYAMIGISFFPLLLLYGIFFDWTTMRANGSASPTDDSSGARAVDTRDRPPKERTGDLAGSAVAGLALVVAVAMAGATQTLNGWPVASYPDFAYRLGDRPEHGHARRSARPTPFGRCISSGLGSIAQSRLLYRSLSDRAGVDTASDDGRCRLPLQPELRLDGVDRVHGVRDHRRRPDACR